MIRVYSNFLKKHPLGALYGVLLGIVAFFAAVPMWKAGAYEAAVVDLAMTGLLIWRMQKKFTETSLLHSTFTEKLIAWLLLIIANTLALLPTHDFPGSLSTAAAFTLLLCAFVLYFSGRFMALSIIIPAAWCCVFMPYHEEFMLLLSFPLRLSATALSAMLLKLCGVDVLCAGTTLTLPEVNIAITDACSGINQVDAFILIAFITVEILHKKLYWKLLHFAFIIPAVIVGNSLRIVLTVLLYNWWGEVVLQNLWHTALGYVQIVLALVIFIAVGKIFMISDEQTTEVQQ